jgi:hypothetical protein
VTERQQETIHTIFTLKRFMMRTREVLRDSSGSGESTNIRNRQWSLVKLTRTLPLVCLAYARAVEIDGVLDLNID